MKAPISRPKAEPFPAGTHSATCYGVVDLGTQETTYQGQTKHLRKLRLQWEVPALRSEFEKDGVKQEGPRVVGKTYTFSTFAKAKLTEHLASWGIGNVNGFDYEDLIGRQCMLSIVQTQLDNKDTISYISSVMQMPEGMPPLTPENAPIYYSIEDHGADVKNIYPWMKELLEKSPEFQALGQAAPSAPAQQAMGEDEEIPF
jgi:hypothetical protein